MKPKAKCLTIVISLVIVSCTAAPAYRLERGELFPGNEPVGQPYAPKRTDIRMVRVSSVQEADSFFVALCQNMRYTRIFTCRHDGMKVWYCRNDKTGGEMTYTHEVPSGTYEVGIIRIMDSVINGKGIREVHFVGTIKPSRE